MQVLVPPHHRLCILVLVSLDWPEQVATAWVGGLWSGFIPPSSEHDIAEHQWIGVQRADNFRDIHSLDISNAGTYGLGLNVEVWLSGIARVSYLGNLLAERDLITNLDLNAARAEMSHQQIAPTTDVDDHVIAALVATVGRSDHLVRSAVQYEGDNPIGDREHRFAVDVVAGELAAA